MTQAKTYRVTRVLGSDDEVPACIAGILDVLRAGETITLPVLYDRLGGRVSASTTQQSAKSKLRKAIIHAQKIGLVVDVSEAPARPYGDFKSLPSVARWLGMLNPANTLHDEAAGGGGTRKSYGYALYRFNSWLAGKKWSITVREAGEAGYYKDVRRDIEVRDVEHLLKLALERGGIDRDLSALLRQFFAEMNAQKSHGTTVMIQFSCAIKSYFTSHEIQYGLKLPRSMLRGTGRGGQRDGWEDRTLKMSEFYEMLSAGKPTIRDRAVLLAKFHRGLDLSTLTDRFNYTAFDQIAAHMGSDDPASWSLDKCPVPIVLTRVKTDYKHTGFLERDAVAANIKWIAERERLTGGALRRGDGQPLYINQFGRPAGPKWVAARFRALAMRTGLCAKLHSGGLSATRHPHQLRHLLKSTLIDSGCRIDVADHVIGHTPKDAYEKQAVLYPDSLRREYAKAAAKINVFTNFKTSIDGSGDIHTLRAKYESDHKKLQETLAAAEAVNMRAGTDDGGGGGGARGPVAEMLASLQNDVRRLQMERDEAAAAAAAAGAGAGGGVAEYVCAGCSLIHAARTCPSCGSSERRIYAAAAGGGGGGRR